MHRVEAAQSSPKGASSAIREILRTRNDTWKWLEKDLTLVKIPGVGHWAQTDAAELVTKTMVRWLAK